MNIDGVGPGYGRGLESALTRFQGKRKSWPGEGLGRGISVVRGRDQRDGVKLPYWDDRKLEVRV